jgi:integrase
MTALAERAAEYLRIRRALGHRMAEAARLLPRFVAHLEAAGLETVTVEAALAWATQPPGGESPSTVWSRRMTIARAFARHLHALDARTEIPLIGLLASPPTHRPMPHLYSETDITALMAAARTLNSPLRVATYETLIGLLAVTGMRIGEAIRLDRGDVDWGEGALVVRDSKFRKSRLLPLQADTIDALAGYERLRAGLCPAPPTPSFFVSRAGTRLIYENVQVVFVALVARAGILARSGQHRPRLHDLRHSFAVNTLLDWYREGVDVHARLPWLSTYLGHVSPSSTYWYLSAAPELMSLVARQLESSLGGRR